MSKMSNLHASTAPDRADAAEAELARVKGERNKLLAQRDDLLAALRLVEWSARDESGRASCPRCRGAKRWRGHDETCTILTALRAAERN